MLRTSCCMTAGHLTFSLCQNVHMASESKSQRAVRGIWLPSVSPLPRSPPSSLDNCFDELVGFSLHFFCLFFFWNLSEYILFPPFLTQKHTAHTWNRHTQDSPCQYIGIFIPSVAVSFSVVWGRYCHVFFQPVSSQTSNYGWWWNRYPRTYVILCFCWRPCGWISRSEIVLGQREKVHI